MFRDYCVDIHPDIDDDPDIHSDIDDDLENPEDNDENCNIKAKFRPSITLNKHWGEIDSQRGTVSPSALCNLHHTRLCPVSTSNS